MADKKKAPRKRTALKASELRTMEVGELEEKLASEQDALMRDRFRHATAALVETSQLKTRRRDIARIATVLNEKKRSG